MVSGPGRGEVIENLIFAAVVLLGSLDLCGQQAGAVRAPLVHLINSKDYANPEQFTFLGPILKDAEVVSLGESIHMTHEFPLVRLGIVRYVNENLGIHMLVMEGSAPDVWIAQDRFLNSAQTAQKCAGSAGWFLWSMEYVRDAEADGI